MGLLDDAIRQHLELKRQHGASEEELQRQEQEALGPARRDVAPAEPSGENGELELEAAHDTAPDALEDETELYQQEEEEPLEAETALRGPESDSAAEPDAPFEPEAEPEPDAEDVEGVPEPEAMPPSPAPVDAASAFEEFGEEDEPEDADASDEDQPEGNADVLEDTPDFLQETPEHDRLWFEQKPPRDFDFD